MHHNSPTTEHFQFHGTGREYFKIWIVNLAFTIATLGIYAAWAKVRTRRYFYQSTELNGNRFDYHGDPKAILKGNLLVVGVIFTYAITSVLFPLVSMFILLAVLLGFPLLLVTSLRFHLANSSYRNLRFNFQGSVAAAYKKLGLAFLITIACLFAIGTVVSFTGLASAISTLQMPSALGLFISALVTFACIATMATAFNSGLRMFVINNSSFGNAAVHSTAKFSQFNNTTMMVFLGAVLASTLMAAFFLALSFGVVGSLDWLDLPAATDGNSLVERMGASATIVVGFLISFSGYLVLFAMGAYLRTAFNNLVWNQAELEGGHRFASTARPMKATRIHLGNWVLIILTLGLFIPFARIRSTRYRIEHMGFAPAGSVDQIVRGEQSKQKAFGDSMGDAVGLELGL